MSTSPTTLVRNLLVGLLAADATLRTLCGRTTGIVVAWNAVQAIQLPVIAVQVSSVREIDGIDDPHDALVLFSAMADGPRGLEVAEALAQRTRELVGTIGMSGGGVAVNPDDVATATIDDPDLVPPGRGRTDLTIRYRVEVA